MAEPVPSLVAYVVSVMMELTASTEVPFTVVPSVYKGLLTTGGTTVRAVTTVRVTLVETQLAFVAALKAKMRPEVNVGKVLVAVEKVNAPVVALTATLPAALPSTYRNTVAPATAVPLMLLVLGVMGDVLMMGVAVAAEPELMQIC